MMFKKSIKNNNIKKMFTKIYIEEKVCCIKITKKNKKIRSKSSQSNVRRESHKDEMITRV